MIARDPLADNPLAAIDPQSPRFFEKCSNIVNALIKIEPEPHSNPYWVEAARNLTLALVMLEIKLAHDAGRLPSLENVRAVAKRRRNRRRRADRNP
jgi:type IV secretory pathway TraG/TraD family ATPase VirD4